MQKHKPQNLEMLAKVHCGKFIFHPHAQSRSNGSLSSQQYENNTIYQEYCATYQILEKKNQA